MIAIRGAVSVLGCAVAALLGSAEAGVASEPAAAHVQWGGFVDAYYAWDVHRPASFDRAYTTQAARQAEFNVNLAFVEARVSRDRARGRLALQWGTSVQANTSGEPRLGAVSGPEVSRFVQEASVGWKLAPDLWVDAGIFLSHMGQESWVSRDNAAYTRSLVAEFSPYYESGVKLTWAVSPSLTAQAVIVNGWQNVSADNSTPGAGVRVDWVPSPRLALGYDNIVADMAADSAGSRVRTWHDAFVVVTPAERWTWIAVASLATEGPRDSGGGSATVLGGVLTARWQARPTLALVARAEALSDPDGRLVATPGGDPFRTFGASFGVDVSPDPALRWRSELRSFSSRDAVWPTRTGGLSARGGALVSSLSLTF